MKYIIEHMDEGLPEWSLIEYQHISRLVGSDDLIITNMSRRHWPELDAFAHLHDEPISQLDFGDILLLDAHAKTELCSEDAENYEYVLIGGILGDHPPQNRTKDLHIQGTHPRNLGEKQMPTDIAVYVAQRILEQNQKLSDIDFTDEITIPTGEDEEVILPFRYPLVDGEPLIAPELIEHLKRRDSF